MSDKPRTERIYSLDWLRIVLILSVFFFHIGLVFSTHNWPIKNGVQFPFLKPIMGFLTLWRMPLLFLVSGIGTQMALGTKSARNYFENRSIKLLLPYVAGLFILLPIQVYYERIPQYDSLLSLYQNLFNGFYPVGNFSLDHHLWFIKYLYLISIVSIPFLLLINIQMRSKIASLAKRLFNGKFGSNWGALVIFLIWESISLELRVLSVDVGRFLIYSFFFLSGLLVFYDRSVLRELSEKKKFFLIQACAALIIISMRKFFAFPQDLDLLLKNFFKSILLWSCAMATLGYFVSLFDFDNKYRKVLNEAIYPFYLLQQPVIVITAYYVVEWRIPVLIKVPLLILLSLALVVFFYMILIKPFKMTRLIFGLKPPSKKPYAIRYASYKMAKLFNTLF